MIIIIRLYFNLRYVYFFLNEKLSKLHETQLYLTYFFSKSGEFLFGTVFVCVKILLLNI